MQSTLWSSRGDADVRCVGQLGMWRVHIQRRLVSGAVARILGVGPYNLKELAPIARHPSPSDASWRLFESHMAESADSVVEAQQLQPGQSSSSTQSTALTILNTLKSPDLSRKRKIDSTPPPKGKRRARGDGSSEPKILWINLNSHSPKAKLLWREQTGQWYQG